MQAISHLHGCLARRAVVRGLSSALLCSAWPALQAQPAPVSPASAEALNHAARFRFLSQRMAKAYCQTFLAVHPSDADAVLAASRSLARASFEALGKEAWSASMGQLAEVRRMWDAMDRLIVQPPTRESVAAVSAQADILLRAAEGLTEAVQSISQHRAHQWINTAGRQRLLSQRLAKNYFLAASGLDSKDVRDQRTADAAEFSRGMAHLAGAPVSSARIRDTLASGQMQWVFFDAALAREPDMRGLRAVATTSERLLEVLDSLTSQYEVVPR